MSMVPLPPKLALKSSDFGLYLTYTDDSYSPAQGYVRVNGSNVFSAVAKFEVLYATVGTGVHLRCRTNKKYLRRRTASSIFISPDAAEPEEDTSNWGCTLFEPRVVEAGNTTRTYLFHVQSQRYAIAWDIEGVRYLTIDFPTPIDPIHQSVFEIIDLESVLVLPKYVAFKADNGKYLRVIDVILMRPILIPRGWPSVFVSDDKGIAECRYQTTTNGHGDVYLKSIYNNKYLRCEADASKHDIKADSDQPSQYGYFRPIKIDANTVALKNTDNQRFAKRYTSYLEDQLSAVSTSMDRSAQLKIEEHVLNRRIYNTVFDLKNAIIYNETPMVMASKTSTNNSTTTDTAELKFTYEDSRSTTWTISHSWMVGIELKASFKVPFIGGTEVTAKTEYSGSYEWGETITTTKTLEATYTGEVPPYSTVQVRLMATEGKCDVTYSYYQLDQLWDGNYETYLKDDGVCKGMNSYNYHFEKTIVRNLDPAYLSDSSVEYPTTVEIIPLPELSDPTRVQHPVTSTATTEEQDLETPVQLTEWIVPALPPETSQVGNIVEEGGEAVA